MDNRTRLRAATVALVVTQLIHAGTPADTASESYVGLVAGLALLVASIVAAIGAFGATTTWAPRLALFTGTLVAVGFVAYHAVPVHSPVTNPYLGEPVGPPAWLSVGLAVAAGAWAAVEGWRSGARLRVRA